MGNHHGIQVKMDHGLPDGGGVIIFMAVSASGHRPVGRRLTSGASWCSSCHFRIIYNNKPCPAKAFLLSFSNCQF